MDNRVCRSSVLGVGVNGAEPKDVQRRPGMRAARGVVQFIKIHTPTLVTEERKRATGTDAGSALALKDQNEKDVSVEDSEPKTGALAPPTCKQPHLRGLRRK